MQEGVLREAVNFNDARHSWDLDRIERHATVSESLARLSDGRLNELVDSGTVLGSGIGGTTVLVRVGEMPIFVKRVPLTELERQPEHWRSTANLFGLPVWCQYGVGSPSFGVWRELAAHLMTTDWVVAGRSRGFPLLHHWRVLDGSAFAGPLPEELGEVDRAVEYWHGSEAVRSRLEAINDSSTTVALFMEHLPAQLPAWLRELVERGREGLDAAVVNIEAQLRAEILAMNAGGLFHFDTHLDNMLTDGDLLYLADFGLATSTLFDLDDDERRFVEANRSHDVSYAITRLVDWLVTEMAGIQDWAERDAYIRRCADGDEQAAGRQVPAFAASVITHYAPVAAIINDFYRSLHVVDRRTPYPADAVERACRVVGLVFAGS
jgi:hypothetical protein